MKLFAEDVKLLVRSSKKEITQMDQNELLFWEDIWKLRFIIEKCIVLNIGFKYIKVQY